MSLSKMQPLVSPLEKYKRDIDKISTPVFLATLAFTPVWATTFLPFTVLYQVGKTLVSPLLPKPARPSMDSGYRVDSASLVPREDRKYDVVILGATGFTGSLAVKYLAKTYGVGKTINWAIAGRSQTKLDQVKQKLAKELGMDELLKIDTIIVDTSIPSTMPRLVEQSRAVATTAGPFALYGNAVVEFCAKFGTHYVDITGEVGWAQNMALKWHDEARQSGARIVPFCGNDSIPWDLLTMKLKDTLKEKCSDNLVKVNCWDQAKAGGPGGTFATVITVVQGLQPKPPSPDKDPFRRKIDGTKSDFTLKSNLPLIIKKANSPWDESSSKRWATPFIMAPVNAQVVSWSHALRSQGSKNLTYKEVMVVPDFKSAFVNYFGLLMVGSMLFNPLTLVLLQKFILPKFGGGPSDKVLNNGYLCVSGEGIGEKGNRVEAFFYFPNEPGCVDTTRMLVESALCLALNEKDLPLAEGGFWSPSTAMGNVLMKRLIDTGTIYDERIVPVK